ncbi:MAG TPA: GLPGLI family protein [Hanamia sp.]
MNKLSLVLLLFICFNLKAQNKTDTSVYLCKYSFEWQKDTANMFSKSNDLMYLEIGKNSSIFYSYYRFLGFRNLSEDLKMRKSLDYIKSNYSRYYQNSETEIIIHNFGKKEFKVIDKLTGNGVTYCYLDSVKTPVWTLAKDTLTILNHLCQMATTTFKGRDYIAWFAPDIPISIGPWQYTGLPGLILRIHDTKNQIWFEATELGSTTASDAAEIEYPNCLQVAKSKLRELKRIQAEDRLAFEKMQNPNLTITYRNSSGEIIQPPHKLKPYNPIDLSK